MPKSDLYIVREYNQLFYIWKQIFSKACSYDIPALIFRITLWYFSFRCFITSADVVLLSYRMAIRLGWM